MIFIAMAGGPGGGGFGGGGHRVSKPFGKSMERIDPFTLLSGAQQEMLKAKQGLINDAIGLKIFESAPNLNQLVNHIDVLVKQLFPNAGSLLLARKNGDYVVVSRQDVGFDPGKLNLSAANSVVRAAGEVAAIDRRTIYLPDLDQPDIFLASEFDTIAGKDDSAYNKHRVEIGTIDESGLVMDLISLKRNGVKSLAVAPILEYKQEDPVGAIILIGEPSFLDPFVDLIALRLVADQVARPLKRKIA